MPDVALGPGLAWSEHNDAADSPEGAGGLPLVLIHGAGGSRLSWPPQIRRMAGAHVYSLDLPGHGRAPGEGSATIGGYAETLLDWLRSREIGRAVLVGHSMGAAVALVVAARRDGPAAGVVLLGLAPKLTVSPRLLELTSSPETAPAAVEKVIELGFAPGTPTERLEQARQRMLEVAPEVVHRDFQACDRFDAGPRLGEIGIPTLVACGSLDRMTAQENCRRLAEGIRGASFQLLEGAGHMAMIERPEEVAELVRGFVRRIA